MIKSTPPHIVIPSADRAAAVLTDVAGQILFVPVAQVSEYRAHNPGTEVIGHPPIKNLALKRQAIYEKFGSVFMLDDDIKFVSRLNLPGNNRENHLTPTAAAAVINLTAATAAAAGCYLYGFSNWPNPKHYFHTKPIRLTGYINASAFGLHPGSRLFFTPHTTAAESHWINLLNAFYHRKAFIDTRYCFAQAPGSTFFRPGGQTRHRTLQTEYDDTVFLLKMFGPAVKIKKNNVRASKKIHPYQRSLNIPL